MLDNHGAVHVSWTSDQQPRMPEEAPRPEVPGHWCACGDSPLRHDRLGCMDCSCRTFERMEQATRGMGGDCHRCRGEEHAKAKERAKLRLKPHARWCAKFNPK